MPARVYLKQLGQARETRERQERGVRLERSQNNIWTVLLPPCSTLSYPAHFLTAGGQCWLSPLTTGHLWRERAEDSITTKHEGSDWSSGAIWSVNCICSDLAHTTSTIWPPPPLWLDHMPVTPHTTHLTINSHYTRHFYIVLHRQPVTVLHYNSHHLHHQHGLTKYY